MSNEPVDLMKPWTIKSIPTRVIEGINAAARRNNLTVGQWVEKRFDEWEGADSPAQSGGALSDLNALMHAAAALATVTKLPREVRTLIGDYARSARGLPSHKHSQARLPGLQHGHAEKSDPPESVGG